MPTRSKWIMGFAVLATLCVVGNLHTAKVYAGVTRSYKNTAERDRMAECATQRYTIYGITWINDTPTTSTGNDRWDENMVVPYNATTVNATMWSDAYNCPAPKGQTRDNAEIYGLKPAGGGQVPISFPYGTSIFRGDSRAGQFTDPPGSLRVRLSIGTRGTGCYTIKYSGRYRDSRGAGATNVSDTRVCITRLPSPAWSLSSSTSVTPTTVLPGQSATFTHRITKSGTGAASYQWRIDTGFYNSPISAPNIGHTAYSAATGSITKTSVFNATAANAGQYYCQRIYYTPRSNTGGTGASVGKCVYIKPITIDCGALVVDPDNLDPYTTFSLTVSATNSTGVALPGDNMTLTITGPGWSYGPVTQPASGSGSTATATFSNIGPTGTVGVFGVKWVYTAAGGFSQTCGYPLDTSAQFDVRYEPYVSVYGGDAMAGASPQIDTTGDPAGCYTNTDAGFTSWNQGSAGNYAGAGAEIAVMALKDINNFASDLPDNPPTYLSFANSATNPVGGDYGGDFGGSVTSCDYTSGLGAPVPLGSLGSTLFVVPPGKLYAYVKGNIVISKNIIYSSTGSWVNPTDIPDFRLVVDGNIYIDHAVTELDGTYVAVATNDGSTVTGGNIYTCTNGSDTYDLDDPTYYDACRNTLTVYGSFVAKNISFQRTFGSLGQASAGDTYLSSKAAERFIYTPELWIPRPGSGDPNAIDSISGAAPTL